MSIDEAERLVWAILITMGYADPVKISDYIPKKSITFVAHGTHTIDLSMWFQPFLLPPIKNWKRIIYITLILMIRIKELPPVLV